MTAQMVAVVAIVATITLVLTVLAFHTKEPMLHAVCVIGWLVVGYLLANAVYPAGNTYVWVAAGAIGFIMAFVEVVALVNVYISGRPHKVTYDEEQAAIRGRIVKLTKKKERYPWD